ncbi:O-methyltransferase [Aureimonas frigidaquae]|uniref:O-methyltransferase family protein n=1 Tax=Aureimonas frigidaquae TaxID=424757 RepID=A0A0P0Z0D9_9HYPH|nr:class I SAM-dependent methyltransferase [Aureimonas frigidaquae]BAT27415.1 O-methyltransferase family protein [Aureimonas frigidaquae]
MQIRPITAPKEVRDVIEREHLLARQQRAAARAAGAWPSEAGAVVDFRTSERHRTAYLSIGPDQGRFLFSIAVASKARNIVEFGSSFGISTLYLASAAHLTGGTVVGSEYHPEKAEKANRSIAEAGLSDSCEIRVGDARETLLKVAPGINLLFLDGAKELYLPILLMLEGKLGSNALVVADNTDHLSQDDPFLAHIAEGSYVTSRLRFGKGEMSLSLYQGPVA